MKLPIYQVDAFTDKVFGGNPAAIVLTDNELPVDLMQSIAAENNLSETAYVCGPLNDLSIRWFTPTVEVALCGHATLAAAHVLFTHRYPDVDALTFGSKSGALGVTRDNDGLWMDFPVDEIMQESLTVQQMKDVMGVEPLELYRGKSDLMAVVDCEQTVRDLDIHFERLKQLPYRGLIVTARGEACDFVSRFFGPAAGIPEDPVTGSAHTTLTPYWAKVLGKQSLSAQQLSVRGGKLLCRDEGERIVIGGLAVCFLKGEITIS